MRKHMLVAVVAGLMLVGAGCANPASPSAGGPDQNAVSAQPSVPAAPPVNAPATPPPSPVVGPASITVTMKPRGGDKEYGTAVLTRVDQNHTKVSISLTNPSSTTTEEAGLYAGPCSAISAPQQYDLSAVVKGKSVTTLNVDLKSFVGGTQQSVRVFEKPLNAQSPLWACGDIK